MDRMLADLEAAQRAEAAAQERRERVDEVRVERAKVRLEDRLRAAVGCVVRVETAVAAVPGCMLEVGSGWCAIDTVNRTVAVQGLEDLVRPGITFVDLGSIEGVLGVGPRHVSDDAPDIGRSWNSLLRRVARSRTFVTWRTAGGAACTGLVDAVSEDHVLLRERSGQTRALTTSALAVLECPRAPSAE